MWGENDPFAPLAAARRFESELPGAELEVIDGAGHFVVDDAPERYAGSLVSVLSRARPGTAR